MEKCTMCSKRNKCCVCGKKLKKEENYLRANPYAEEIAGIDTLHKICGKCYEESIRRLHENL